MKSPYIVGELCALNGDDVPVFSRLQAAMDKGRADQLVFFVFDLLFLNGESTAQMPLNERKRNMSEAEQPDLYEPDGRDVAGRLFAFAPSLATYAEAHGLASSLWYDRI